MARTAITVTTLVPNTPASLPAGTAIDATNNHSITLPTGLPSSAWDEIILICKNTFAGTKTVTVKAGDNPPATHAGQGDLTALSLTDGSTTPQYGIIGPLKASRFMQDDGTINVDVAASMTGTIAAIYIPRTA